MVRQSNKPHKIALFGHGKFARPSFGYIRKSPRFGVVSSPQGADVALVANYGRIIREPELSMPKFGFLNLHASLLPSYRGASPIQFALLEGAKKTGVTMMVMDEKLDHGAIVAQSAIKIAKTDDYLSLLTKLGIVARKLTSSHLLKFLSGEITPKPQDHSRATFAPKITRDMTEIFLGDSPEKALAKVRAFSPRPKAFIKLKRKKLFILSARIKKGLFLPEQVQLEGRKVMDFSDFARGWRGNLPEILKAP